MTETDAKAVERLPWARSSISGLAGALLLSVVACQGMTNESGASGGNASVASAGAAGESSPANGTSGGTAGLGEIPNGGGVVGSLDYSLSQCGQHVYDIDTWCAQSPGKCTRPLGPSCATATYDVLSAGFPYRPPSVRSGCGYLFVWQPVIEGNDETIVYDLKTDQLIYYSTMGWPGKGCEVSGERTGQIPACEQTRDLCADADAGAEGGA